MNRNYRSEDIGTVLEMRREVLHHLEQIEMHLWTDNLQEASRRAVEMHRTIAKIHDLKMGKQHESAMNQLFQSLNANGIHVQMVNFPHKKTD